MVQNPTKESQTQEQTSESDRMQKTNPNGAASESDSEPEGSKILVAYFSATNNTEGVAQKIADELGADLYEIVPEQPYTDEDLDYGNTILAKGVTYDPQQEEGI